MATTSSSTTSSSERREPGILGRLPHSDLLTFLYLAQQCYSNLLEYTPRYDDHDSRAGGNASVQMVYLSSGLGALDSLPSYAFKRHDLVRRLDFSARLKKLICELIIYENPTIACHPNITNLQGISWSTTDNSSLPKITPVLGFQPSKGNLADVFKVEDFNFVQRLEICRDIGRALETVHSLNIAHGDLKPENVLVHVDSAITAKLIDFDSSSFGVMNSDLVVISGTRGWLAPELNRRNRTVTLSEAFIADTYSFGKLCAWILFENILKIEEYMDNEGRTHPHEFEAFDFQRAIESLQDNEFAHVYQQYSEENIFRSLKTFFSITFVGSSEQRSKTISRTVQLLEQALRFARALNTSNQRENFDILTIATDRIYLCRQKCGLTKGPYRYSRYRITQSLCSYIIRFKNILNGSNNTEPNFAEKQWIYRVHHSTTDIIIRFWTITWQVVILGGILLSIIFSIEEHIKFGIDGCFTQANDTRRHFCLGATFVTFTFGLQFSILCIRIFWKFSKPIRLMIQRNFRKYGPIRDIEMRAPSIRQIGYQVYQETRIQNTFLQGVKRLGTIADDSDLGYIPPVLNKDILSLLEHRGKHLHLLPDIVSMGPLLNRLHYRFRSQIVDNLRQRLGCQLCYQRAKDLLATCALLGFGHDSPIEEQSILDSETVYQILKKDFQADSWYTTALPQLPFAVRNQLQDDRADLFTLDEIPSAIRIILSELLIKLDQGTKCRNTQILCTTLGRLFALFGRHEDAELCFSTSLTYKEKPIWRTYNEFSSRLTAYAAPEGISTTRRRNQLLEAEHDLFLFSLVHELDILGRHEEAFRELQGVRNIRVAPNGLYLERETGSSLRLITHRVTDARNVYVSLLLKYNMLDELENIGQEFDLLDLTGVYGFAEHISPEHASQCFVTTEQVALGFYRRGQFLHAMRLQRRLLIARSKGIFHKTDCEMRRIYEALALSFSRYGKIDFLEKANRIQTKLISQFHNGDRSLFDIRLNNIYTLSALGHLETALLQITVILSDDQEWKNMAKYSKNMATERRMAGSTDSRLPFVWLYTIPDAFRTRDVIQRALLTICALIENKEAQLKLITLLCANPPTSSPLDNFEDLTEFLMSTLLENSASVSQQVMIWDRLICLLVYVGLIWDLPEKFDLALRCIDDMTNTVSLISDDSEDEFHLIHLTALVLRMKAYYITTVQGFGVNDRQFWDGALAAHRKTFPNGSSDTTVSLLKHSLFAMLKCKVLAFYNEVEIQEILEIYQDIDQQHESEIWKHIEYAHLRTDLSLFKKEPLIHEEQPFQAALETCISELGADNFYTNQTRSRLAGVLKGQGKFSEAQHLLNEVEESMKTEFGPEHPQTLRARFDLLKLQSDRHMELGLHPHSSLADLSNLRYLAAKILGKEHTTTQEYLGCYALALARDKSAIQEAISIKRDVVKVCKHSLGPKHTRTIHERGELAYMLCTRGGEDHREGRNNFELSLRDVEEFLGVSHPKTLALWRQCVSAVPHIRNLSSEQIIASQNFNPEVGEIHLSFYLLGAGHPLTKMLQQTATDAYNHLNLPDEEFEKYFPVPKPKPMEEQWNQVLEPLCAIANQQRVQHRQELDAAIRLGQDNSSNTGGFQFKFVNRKSLDEEEGELLDLEIE